MSALFIILVNHSFPFVILSFCLFVIVQMNQVSPQQTDVIEHHYVVFEKLQKIKAETEEVCDIPYLTLPFSQKGWLKNYCIISYMNEQRNKLVMLITVPWLYHWCV